MPQDRTINWIRITIARDSVGGVKMEKYIDHLLTEVYELPGIVLETEIDVVPGDAASFQACVNGDEGNPEVMSEELKTVAAKVLKSMQK